MRLYRVTEVSSSVQSVFITEETNFQSVTLLKQSQKLAILLPQRQKKKKDSKHHIYTPSTQRRENYRKDSFDHSHLHNVLYWSIRRHQRASALLSFFSFSFF